MTGSLPREYAARAESSLTVPWYPPGVEPKRIRARGGRSWSRTGRRAASRRGPRKPAAPRSPRRHAARRPAASYANANDGLCSMSSISMPSGPATNSAWLFSASTCLVTERPFSTISLRASSIDGTGRPRWVSSGHAVEAFASAREFLARERHDGPGCLVLDLRMQEMTGLELQDALERQRRLDDALP